MADSTSVRPLRVFLCHASSDKPAVRELYQRLRADGIDAWLDKENLLPGQDWQRAIPKAVRDSDVVLVCLSHGSITKAGYVQKEIKFALDVADEQPEDTIFLIPLKLEECDVPDRLSRWQWVNLFTPNGYERLMRALRVRAGGLAASIESPSSPAPSDRPATPSVSSISGGVNITSGQTTVGKHIVGRDKIVQANTYIEHATIIQPTPSVQKGKVAAPPEIKSNVRTIGGIEFVHIPAGKFLMGSKDDNKLAEDREKPQHRVDISYDYWIARYEVTNDQFAKFVEATKREREFDQGQWQTKADHPVVKVTWHDAMAYSKWLNETLRAELGDQVVRLPTEAEWEKAARGEYGNEWPWGNDFDPKRCNSSEGGKGGTTPVGAYSPQGDSPYGVSDMVGNVWEWCHSIFWTYPYKIDDGRESESQSGTRVARGGSLNSNQRGVRAVSRYRDDVGDHFDDLGLRVVVAPALS